jgi:isoleucyl-tRNA synthetase
MTEENSEKGQSLSQKSEISKKEEKILDFWNKNKIFKKTLDKSSPKGDFVFYDGPPFATGEPHYGHVVPGTVKDIIPRYKTMQGYNVRRRWGWDCHGLPIENLIEKELGLASKKDIVDYGIDKFNQKARESVMRYADDWRKIIPRLGRWVDMDNDYRTMDASYTESVWWSFSTLYKKGLIYEGFKSMNLCPRCETTLSNFEVGQGYKDITDISVYVKLEMVDEPKTFMLAWTTTPWTLPGNVALAINPDFTYLKIKIGEEKFILAENRINSLKNIVKDYEVIEKIPSSKLIGKTYKPVFGYYVNDKNLKNIENAFKVYGADFVTNDSGTGIVHIAPAFGSDDYDLSKKYNLPFIQHVHTNGVFKSEVTDFAGQQVKPKDTKEDKEKGIESHQKADIEIIKHLAHKGLLFAKEKLVHSYPHCWRCETPLLNYAASSWFVKVTDLKDKLVKENNKIDWVPKEVGEGRFGNWLLGARDWAISRSRFWGAPIPVWKDEKTNKCYVFGSVKEMHDHAVSNNNYFVMRHGESLHNTKNRMSTRDHGGKSHLTENGKKEVEKTAQSLLSKKIDIVIVSPFARTKETFEIVNKVLNIPKENVIFDERIAEINAGEFDGKTIEEYHAYFANDYEYFTKTPPKGENFTDIRKRCGNILYELDNKYKGKNILLISHDTTSWLLDAVSRMVSTKELIESNIKSDYINHAECKKLDFKVMPHNDSFELELHRPYIDEVKLYSKEGNVLVRVPEVFDCWFESGSMPYGESHYPFNKQEFNPVSGISSIFKKSKGYPADFIAEGLDQTRGWFYSMLVLGVGLFGKSPFKNVVVNGLVLAEDGQKMSKSKKNYPNISLVVDKYGADALRFFLMSSPVVRSQDVRFSEKLVDEIVKKNIGRLNNVISFYEMYADNKVVSKQNINNPLDLWIFSRLNQVNKEITTNLEKYEIDRAVRPISEFIDDLSVWYIRRSRDRFKSEERSDKESALYTTRAVLIEFSKLLAPFMPFFAEDIYQRMKGEKESVHLEDWPKLQNVDEKLISDMKNVREIATKALEARMNAKINVRQPLSTLKVKSDIPKDEKLLSIIKDEVNVKSVLSDSELNTFAWLDTNITPELKIEGEMRELVRVLQDMRKEAGLTVDKIINIDIGENYMYINAFNKYKDYITKVTGLNKVNIISGDVPPHIHN